jgi:D-alanine-D-alanine ligase
MKKAIILINKLFDNPTDDEKDVLDQADEVEIGLVSLGYTPQRLFMGLNLEETRDSLLKTNPDLVFNLVEGIDGKANLIHLAPALLESLRIPFTGCRPESMFITSNKILTKKILDFNKIRTPRFYEGSSQFKLIPRKSYIAKPLWEDASVGITDKSVFTGHDSIVINDFRDKWGNSFFIEEFIDGREFNVSVLGGENGPQVMPLAEMLFNDFPEGKPKIVGYSAKWDMNTFEYNNTLRTFEYSPSDLKMRDTIHEMALQCWRAFSLTGYTRVDFRVDQNEVPYVLEVNANPCIAKDAGFFVACSHAGLSYVDMLKRMIYEAHK